MVLYQYIYIYIIIIIVTLPDQTMSDNTPHFDPSVLWSNDRERFPNILARFKGYDYVPDLECLAFRLYARPAQWIPLVHNGQWTMCRDVDNKRYPRIYIYGLRF